MYWTMRARQRGLMLALVGLLGLTVLFTAVLVAGWAYAIILLGILCLYALPGLPWAIAWLGRPSLANPLPIVVGLSYGIVLSMLLCSAAVRLFGWATWAIVVPPLLAYLPGHVYLRFRNRTQPKPPESLRFDAPDYAFLGLVDVLLLGLLAVPLLRVGHVVGTDHWFHSLFGLDYLARSGYGLVALRGLPPEELVAAGLPPRAGYYVYYALNAFVLHIAKLPLFCGAQSEPPYQVLSAGSLYLAVMFVFILMLNVKAVVPSRLACYGAIACGLFAYSYNGFYVLIKRLVAPAAPGLIGFLADRGALQFSDVSKGWYRDFLVEQQAVLSLILLFTCFLLLAAPRRETIPWSLAVAVGVMLAGAFGSDSFLGTIGVLWLAVYMAWRCVKGGPVGRWQWLRTGLVCFASAAFSLTAAVGSGIAPRLSAGSSLTLGINKMIAVLGPVYLPLDFGPPLFLGLAGLLLAYRMRPRGPGGEPSAFFGVLALGCLCLACAAFLMHEDPTAANAVVRKAGKIFRFVLVIGCAHYLYFLGSGTTNSLLVRYPRIVLALVLLGLPVIAIDFAVFTGIFDDGRSSQISCADYDACEWVRMNTPLRATVQSLPEYKDGYYETTPVAQIGGRAIALGYTSDARITCKANNRDFARLLRDIFSIFEPQSREDTEKVLREHSIAYVYVGAHERAWRPGGTDKYYANPQLFAPVYSRNGVDIFLYRNNTQGYTAAP
jgi:hypothetical protein